MKNPTWGESNVIKEGLLKSGETINIHTEFDRLPLSTHCVSFVYTTTIFEIQYLFKKIITKSAKGVFL